LISAAVNIAEDVGSAEFAAGAAIELAIPMNGTMSKKICSKEAISTTLSEKKKMDKNSKLMRLAKT
jgi:hypothetical protein